MADLHVLFTLGISPAVITETLWALVVQDRQTIHSIEVWTTEIGRKKLCDAHDSFVAALQIIEDQAPGHLPPPPTLFELYGDRISGSDDRRGWIVRIPEDEHGRRINDPRSSHELGLLLAALDGRLREIRRSERTLFGVLAGGRKTMASILQLAMSMQGRPGDRLLHVLLDERLDRHVSQGGVLGRERAKDGPANESSYWLPTEAEQDRYGVPINKQVLLVDVPFPRLHPHVDAGDDWNEAWGRWLDAYFVLQWAGLDVCVTQEGQVKSLKSISLTKQHATLLLALAMFPDGLNEITLENVIRSSRPPLAGKSKSTSAHLLSQAVSRLNKVLSEELPLALRYLRVERTQSEGVASWFVLRGAGIVQIDAQHDLTASACNALRSVFGKLEARHT